MDDSPSSLRRRRAVVMYYHEHRSKAAICRELGCSRPWLDRWLKRYNPDQPEESLKDRSKAPHRAANTWPEGMRQTVVGMRRLRSKQPYALRGAQAIHYELKHLGYDPVPPVRTIHRWLEEAGLIQKRQVRRTPSEPTEIPLPKGDSVNAVQQLDLKGPIYLRNDSHKYYVAVLRDVHSHRVSLNVLKSRKASEIVAFVLESWRWMGVPHYLQMDNALEFRGSNRYPRSLSQVARAAIAAGSEVVYIPVKQPCYNGGVEHYNGFIEERLLPVPCADYAALCEEARRCQEACNATHRISALDGETPNEYCQATSIRLLDASITKASVRSLILEQGFVTYVRKIRKSGRVTLSANDRFMVDPGLVGAYVAARIDVAAQQVTISHKATPLLTYDYSRQTVGAWADGLCNGSSSTTKL